MKDRPILGITMGDPCGIGPEVTVRALASEGLYQRCRPIIVGGAEAVKRAMTVLGLNLKVNTVNEVSEAAFRQGCMDVLNIPVDLSKVPYGQVSPAGGEAAFRAVERVIALALAREVDATVTGPLNKEAMNLAGHHYSGHTEIYADKTGTRDYCMMLADGNLRVVHVSTHVALREACNRCTKERELAVIRLANETAQKLGVPAPRIAVAGLNPHAGENGLFGREEIEEILPAIERAKALGIVVEGPLPPDTVFSKALGGMYDMVVAQYHDQGHIPLKVLGFRMDRNTGLWKNVTGVNITLGLPIIRSAVDHGTAFDQAGKGTASEQSMINAIDYAIRLATKKQDEPAS